jgi:hypothetical protein
MPFEQDDACTLVEEILETFQWRNDCLLSRLAMPHLGISREIYACGSTHCLRSISTDASKKMRVIMFDALVRTDGLACRTEQVLIGFPLHHAAAYALQDINI